MAVIDALDGSSPDVDELGFIAGRCGGGALLSFLGTAVVIGADDVSMIASRLCESIGGADK